MLAGLIMLAAWMLLPADDELTGLRRQRERLEFTHARLTDRLRAHANFADELSRSEPAFLERLAAAQLRLIPEGDRPVYLIHPVSASPSHRIDQMIAARPWIDPPAAPEPSLLTRLVDGPLRLWIAAGAVTCLFTGLLIGPALRTRAGGVGEDEDEDEEDDEAEYAEDEYDDDCEFEDEDVDDGEGDTLFAGHGRAERATAAAVIDAEADRLHELRRWDPWSQESGEAADDALHLDAWDGESAGDDEGIRDESDDDEAAIDVTEVAALPASNTSLDAMASASAPPTDESVDAVAEVSAAVGGDAVAALVTDEAVRAGAVDAAGATEVVVVEETEDDVEDADVEDAGADEDEVAVDDEEDGEWEYEYEYVDEDEEGDEEEAEEEGEEALEEDALVEEDEEVEDAEAEEEEDEEGEWEYEYVDEEEDGDEEEGDDEWEYEYVDEDEEESDGKSV